VSQCALDAVRPISVASRFRSSPCGAVVKTLSRSLLVGGRAHGPVLESISRLASCGVRAARRVNGVLGPGLGIEVEEAFKSRASHQGPRRWLS
jgi:hypothetical protein